MTSILVVVLIGVAMVWMLMPSRPGARRSYTPTSGNPGWWGSTWGGPYVSGPTHSSHSTDCGTGFSGDGGGSCGGGGDGG
jgi:hypothetical protein